MKVQQCSYNVNAQNNHNNQTAHKNYAPQFKGGADLAFNFAGALMQRIQGAGFLATFLIQDGIGMTAPRVGAAFLRDKEVTGHLNTQEGFEVLGREGLTGPLMMAVAPVMLLLSAKFGRSTGVNSQLIRRLGDSLKEMISKPGFDKTLLKNASKLKSEFYRKNVTETVYATVGKENVKAEDLNFILDQLEHYNSKPTKEALKNIKGMFKTNKYKKQCLANINERINNIKMQHSSDLDLLDCLKLGKGADEKAFSTTDVLEAIVKYGDDAIVRNKHLEKLDPASSDFIRDKAIGQRFITTIATITATLTILSVLPKIYAKNEIAPGARTAMQMKESELEAEKLFEETEGQDNVSFKGKGGIGKATSKLGKFLREKFGDKYASELEYNGHNFTNTLMAALSLFGLLVPRGTRAVRRAQVDEDGKKDLTELWEILIRDLTSSMSVIFAVPMLTRAFVTGYEDRTGFVLMHRDRSKTGMKKVLDLINPYSKSHVLLDNELQSLYGNVDNTNKMLNFCKYIDKNNGDLQKIFSKSDFVNEMFNKETVDFAELTKLSKAEKNKKIIEFFERNKENKSLDESIKKLMQCVEKNAGKAAKNGIFSFARGMNSVPAAITTFAISPFLLGWIIPRLTYSNTRRIHNKKLEEERQKNLNAQF